MLHFLQLRALSGAEAVNALRPFYLAVHPDFFGQHPRERVRLDSVQCVSSSLLSSSSGATQSNQAKELKVVSIQVPSEKHFLNFILKNSKIICLNDPQK